MTEPRLLHDKPAAAAQLSVSLRVLEQLIHDGKIETVTIGRRRYVPHVALEDYVARLRKSA